MGKETKVSVDGSSGKAKTSKVHFLDIVKTPNKQQKKCLQLHHFRR